MAGEGVLETLRETWVRGASTGDEEFAAAGDATYTTDIPLVSGGGVALFNTANPANFTFANRLDAVGFINVPPLYREVGLNRFPVSSSGTNYFQVRSMAAGVPQDTGDNENDFGI